jgi:hypothetical protein
LKKRLGCLIILLYKYNKETLDIVEKIIDKNIDQLRQNYEKMDETGKERLLKVSEEILERHRAVEEIEDLTTKLI